MNKILIEVSVGELLDKISILEIGAGSGELAREILCDFSCASYKIVERDSDFCDVLKKVSTKIEVIKNDFLDLKLPEKEEKEEKFDLIISLDCLEHVKNDQLFLNKAYEYLVIKEQDSTSEVNSSEDIPVEEIVM